MANSGSYKDKLAAVVKALDTRNKEAAAWKSIADHRLASLVTMSAHITRFEASFLRLPALTHIDEAADAFPRSEPITDGPSVNDGVSSVEDVIAQMRELLASLSSLTMESADILSDNVDLSLSVGMPDLDELDDDEKGLTLDEMRGASTLPYSAITPPPDSLKDDREREEREKERDEKEKEKEKEREGKEHRSSPSSKAVASSSGPKKSKAKSSHGGHK